jgi:hypothetical protein
MEEGVDSNSLLTLLFLEKSIWKLLDKDILALNSGENRLLFTDIGT